MAEQSQMDQIRTTIRVSSSIANFREKLIDYLKLPVWHWWENRDDRVIFFGLYHRKDYIRFLWHRGPKKVFWCGSDIVALQQKRLAPKLIQAENAKHYCENGREQAALYAIGIKAEIRPMLFDDPDKYPFSYQRPEVPNIYMSCHKGREEEYGVGRFVDLAHEYLNINFHIYGIEKPELWFDGSINEMRNLYYQLPNLIYHGRVSGEQFNAETQNYQGCMRFNEFDGFAETLAKAALRGQHIFSAKINIPYSYGVNGVKLEAVLADDSKNVEMSNYWRKTLKENKEEVVNWR